jgi:mono/diheme cytochrome c family protein
MTSFAARFSINGNWVRRVYVAALAGSLVLVAACQQKMAKQPSYRPQEESSFFSRLAPDGSQLDGRSARPLEQGTFAIGLLSPTDPLMTGLTAEGQKAKTRVDQAAIPAGAPDNVKNYVDVFPFKITEDNLKRGLNRYTVFCTPCHGPLGDGKGKIVERGYLKPTSYYLLYENGKEVAGSGLSRGFGRYRINVRMSPFDAAAKNDSLVAPVGYYFEVISRGFGGMPDYSSQISAEDRWNIIAYIRALQLSQSVNLQDLPKDVQEAARKAIDEAAKEHDGGHHQ